MPLAGLNGSAFPPFLTLLLGAASAVALGLTLAGLHAGFPLYVAASGLVLAAIMLVPVRIGAFLRFFVLLYAFGYLGLLLLFSLAPVLPAGVAGYLPPPLTGFTAAAFALLALALARVPVIAEIFAIADPYFETSDRGTITLTRLGKFSAPEKWIAMALLAIIIAINLGQVAISVALSYWSRDWLDSIQNKNQVEFWRLLYQVWVPFVAVLIATNLIEFVLVSAFKIRWRAWITTRLIDRWLDQSTHYRLQFNQTGIDNPDQRIQEDIRKYVETTYTLTIAMISQISTLVSFSVILWGLSASLTLPGTETKVPGLLFWMALVYAAIGTIVAHGIGRKLIGLNYQQETYEADFRFGLARLREYAEPVALLAGEPAEKNRLGATFASVIANFYRIVSVQKWLSAFTQLYGASNSVIPYVVAAPFYFVGQISFGVLNQTAGAFSRVDAALSFFIDRYYQLADYKAVCDRLNGFHASIEVALAGKKNSKISAVASGGSGIVLSNLALRLPDTRVIAQMDRLEFRRGERVLLVGPSGSGKSTLFRAIAGIWPFGDGTIAIPAGDRVMLLPQRPYLPIGSLRAAISYPSTENSYSEGDILQALEAVRLPHLSGRIDEINNWAQILSGGEQQRLAVARALLARPDWLFLDEATSALDEPLEIAVYAAIRTLLAQTTIISIGHRSSLIALHDRRLEMRLGEGNIHAIRDAPDPASSMMTAQT